MTDLSTPNDESGVRLLPPHLADRIDALPAQRAGAALVVQVSNDESASASDLGAAVLGDAVLSIRLLRLANSAYYGLPREVRDPAQAVRILGFPTVRAIATAELAHATANGPSAEVFWRHGARVGAACSMLAARVGLRPGEAFAIGLLHDIGQALLADPAGMGTSLMHDACGPEHTEELRLEQDRFGANHAEAGAHFCDVISLPEHYADAIRNHHTAPHDGSGPAHRLVVAALDTLVLGDDVPVPPQQLARLADFGVTLEEAHRVSLASTADAAHLAATLRGT